MDVKLFVIFGIHVLGTLVSGKLSNDFIQRQGLSKENFDYVQGKRDELKDLVGKTLGLQPTPKGLIGESSSNREDVVYYSREQMDIIVNFYKKLRSGQDKLMSDDPGSRSKQRKNTKKPKRRRNKSKGKKGREKRKIADFGTHTSMKWNLTIKYKIDGSFDGTKKQMIKQAVAHWQERTCIRFNLEDEGTPMKEHHLYFGKWGNQCAASLGVRTDLSCPSEDRICDVCECPQSIYGHVCKNTGQFIHEIGHIIGLAHEHARMDRDLHVNIIKANINTDNSENFMVVPFTKTNIPYDVGSIMQYSGYASGIIPMQQTITTKNPLLQKVMGQRAGLSFYDMKTVNLEYCSHKCQRLRCTRDGFENPNNCSQCVCPDGFGGKLCGEVAKSSKNCPSFSEIFLNDTKEKCTDFTPSSGDMYQCNLRIYTRKDWKINVFNQTVDIKDCDGTHCCDNWGEIKHQGDLRFTGPRYCGKESLTNKLLSDNNEVMIVLKQHTPSKRRTFKFCYRAADPSGSPSPVTKVSKITKAPKSAACKMIGPVGVMDESRGKPFSDKAFKSKGKISEMEICVSNTNGVLSSLQFSYGKTLGPSHGRKANEKCKTETLAANEFIIKVSGFASISVWELTLHTNKGRTIGPHGNNFRGHVPFKLESKGQHLIYIEGRAGDLVDQLKFQFCKR